MVWGLCGHTGRFRVVAGQSPRKLLSALERMDKGYGTVNEAVRRGGRIQGFEGSWLSAVSCCVCYWQPPYLQLHNSSRET